ncbi:MAG: glycoside hydrolase family 43 protein [Bacteroidales bacterium]
MNKTILIITLFLLLIVASCGEQDNNKGFELPAINVPLGDPFILLHGDTYYAYGTNAEDGIEVYSSDDLVSWRRHNQLALHKRDSWGDRWFWAPEVYFINGKFYMYYSADEHICVAISESPLGPFTQEEMRPMIDNEKSIDNSLFIDDEGKAYISFVRFNDGNNIWLADLSDDYLSIKQETMVKCLAVSQPWEEVWPRVNEGSFIVKHNGVYYMTYSANSYESPMYGVGYATSTNINGDWLKYNNNPILQNPSGLTGVGHSANFIDKEGNMRIVFHAHHNRLSVHPRTMHIATIIFEKNINNDIMTIDSNSIINCKIN